MHFPCIAIGPMLTDRGIPMREYPRGVKLSKTCFKHRFEKKLKKISLITKTLQLALTPESEESEHRLSHG